jgi:putative restriction endonuclease
MDKRLLFYLHKFSHLRTDRTGGWTTVTQNQAPHKPILLLHRCAFCGVRMLTSDGRTAVDAAHIIPWSLNHNDDPHNGIALCGLCHWTFDQGLLGVSVKYRVLLSSELRITQNVPGHLLTLEGRSIIGPQEQALWPHVEALNWHYQNIFRQG